MWLENFVNFGELRLGKERANRLFQIKDMMDAGLIVLAEPMRRCAQ